MIRRLLVASVALGVTARAMTLRRKRLQAANTHAIMEGMDSLYATDSRLVVVPLALLDEVCELARLAAERIADTDPLHRAILGSVGSVRAAALPEP